MKVLDYFFKRPRKEIAPLRCPAETVAELMYSCLVVNAPCLNLIFRYRGKTHRLGIVADYSKTKGYYDIRYYLDMQSFRSLQSFCEFARIAGTPFVELGEIEILRDCELGDPRANSLLSRSEILRT